MPTQSISTYDRDLVLLKNRAITGVSLAVIAKNHGLTETYTAHRIEETCHRLFHDVATLGYQETLDRYHLTASDYEHIRAHYLASRGIGSEVKNKT